MALLLTTTRYVYAWAKTTPATLIRSQAKGEYVPFYRNSLLYLACIDVEKDLTAEDRLIRAHDLSIAALLGDEIYNFGELVSTADRNYPHDDPVAHITYCGDLVYS